MPKEQAASSLEYIAVDVAVVPIAAPVENDVVEMAFVPGANLDRPGDPDTAGWHPAVWLHPAGNRAAACLVGPGGAVQLARGNYVVWVRIHDSPEVPAIAADVLTIT